MDSAVEDRSAMCLVGGSGNQKCGFGNQERWRNGCLLKHVHCSHSREYIKRFEAT